jgi:hypothetical protein
VPYGGGAAGATGGDWQACQDPQGHTYYVNQLTGASEWEDPSAIVPATPAAANEVGGCAGARAGGLARSCDDGVILSLFGHDSLGCALMVVL